MKTTFQSAFRALTTASVCGALAAGLICSAGAQRDRYWRDRYSRGSYEEVRRLVDRTESTSNEFREVFERYERDYHDEYSRDYRGDRYDRDYRDYRRDRYDRDYRYNGGRSLTAIKPYVQQMDEGLERLRSEVNNRDRYRDARSTLSDVLSYARTVDRSLDRWRGRGSEMTSLWSRLRSELNQLAGIYDLQRI